MINLILLINYEEKNICNENALNKINFILSHIHTHRIQIKLMKLQEWVQNEDDDKKNKLSNEKYKLKLKLMMMSKNKNEMMKNNREKLKMAGIMKNTIEKLNKKK